MKACGGSKLNVSPSFELYEGTHSGLNRRYAPLVAWLAERLDGA